MQKNIDVGILSCSLLYFRITLKKNGKMIHLAVSWPGPNLACVQSRTCLVRKKRCFEKWNPCREEHVFGPKNPTFGHALLGDKNPIIILRHDPAHITLWKESITFGGHSQFHVDLLVKIISEYVIFTMTFTCVNNILVMWNWIVTVSCQISYLHNDFSLCK